MWDTQGRQIRTLSLFLFLLIWSIELLLLDFHNVGVISGLCRHVLAQYGYRNCAEVLKGFEVLLHPRRRSSLPARSAPGPSMWKGLGPSMWKGSGPGTTRFHVLAQSSSRQTCFLEQIVSFLWSKSYLSLSFLKPSFTFQTQSKSSALAKMT